MKIKEIEIGKMFIIEETLSYPKLRIENGYIDMRDKIIKTTSDVLEWDKVREVSIGEVAEKFDCSYYDIKTWYKDLKMEYIG